jgi:hypothetical protein
LADGTVVACERDQNANQAIGMVSGDVSFDDVWRRKTAAGIRRVIRDHPDKLIPCRNCPFWNRPETDVSARSILLNDRISYEYVLAGNEPASSMGVIS